MQLRNLENATGAFTPRVVREDSQFGYKKGRHYAVGAFGLVLLKVGRVGRVKG